MKPATRRCAGFVALLTVGLLPGSAQAHLGIATNDLYGGMLHPLLHLASLLPMLAFALWLSCCKPSSLRRLIPTYLVAAMLGALVGWAQPALLNAEPLLIGLAAVIGIATTLYRRLPLWSSLPVATLTGLLVGYDNVAKVSANPGNPLLFAVGMTLVMGLVVLHITALLYGRQQLWVRTGARIVGSWITAAALLMMALQFSHPGLEQGKQTRVQTASIRCLQGDTSQCRSFASEVTRLAPAQGGAAWLSVGVSRASGFARIAAAVCLPGLDSIAAHGRCGHAAGRGSRGVAGGSGWRGRGGCSCIAWP